MAELTETMRSNPVVFPRIMSQPRILIGVIYLAGYVLLDWISFIEPYAPFGITPWNPGTGLSFALVLLFGRQMIPFLFVSPMLSDFVNQHVLQPWYVELACVVLIGGGYAAATALLLHQRMRFDPALSS